MKIIPQLSALDKARFWKKVNKDCDRFPALENPDLYSHVVGNCWEWRDKQDKNGYGKFKINGQTYRSHRVAYAHQYNKDPGNFLVCHHCDNPSCIRKEHIYLGTNQDNVNDMMRRNRHRTNPAFGEDAGSSKLTEREVQEIARLYYSGEMNQTELCDKFSITTGTVCQLLSGNTWKHLDLVDKTLVVDKRKVLSVNEVKEIYYRYWTEEGLSQSDLAKEYNVDQANIGYIVRGETWSYVTNKIKLPYKLNKECIKDKLTESDIYEIFHLYNSREMTRSEIAKKFNIAVSSLDQILRGQKWSHLDLSKTRKKIAPECMDEKTVISIYTDFWTDKSLSQRQIAEKYGVSQGTVSHIASSKSWVEITSKINLPEKIDRSQGILKDYQIVEIFIRYHKERPTYVALGKEYGVSGDRVSSIVRRLYKPELTEGIAI